MKKIFPIGRFDPRLAAELKTQRKTILLGMVCVAVMSILDGLTIPLLQKSISAIQDAAPSVYANQQRRISKRDDYLEQAKDIAKDLGLDPAQLVKSYKENESFRQEVNKAFDETTGELDDQERRASSKALSVALKVPQEKVLQLLEQGKNSPQGNLGQVRKLGIYCLLVMLVFSVKYWFTRGQSYYLTMAAARLSTDLRQRLFGKLQRLPISYFGEKRVGEIQSVLTNDVNVYQNAVSIIRDSIDGPMRALIAFGYIIITQRQLAGVTFLFLPAMAYVINRNGKKMRSAQSDVQADLAELSGSTNESLQGMRVVKAFAAEQLMVNRYSGLVEKSFNSQLFAARRYASLRPLVELIGAGAMAAVLYLCGWLSFKGQLELGQVAALIFALDRINQGLRSIGSVTSTYNQVQAASDRIYGEVLDVPDQVQDDHGMKTIKEPKGQIEFKNVTFRYPDGTEALRNVSFLLAPGTSLALVGPSGAGKSTIADLLLRFYDPSEGQVLFDGVDIRELSISWLRNQIGVVPQQTFLFAGSIADNIRMGDPSASDEDLRIAAKDAHVLEFVDQMEAGFNSQLGESGAGISGGQKQRVAIARALVRKPSLLLLDEATSALDAESEKAVTEALDEVMQERTTLFIAHRLTTAARASKILVLSKGQVIEQGSHTDLLAANGAYAGLFRAFSGGILD